MNSIKLVSDGLDEFYEAWKWWAGWILSSLKVMGWMNSINLESRGLDEFYQARKWWAGWILSSWKVVGWMNSIKLENGGLDEFHQAWKWWTPTAFQEPPFLLLPRVIVVEPCQSHTHKRIDVFVLAKGGDGVPTKTPDEGKTGWIMWRIWRHSAVEQWKLLSVTQRRRRRTERHLKHATYRLQQTYCGVMTSRAFGCKGL